jgi:hypothetical protein
MAALAANFTLQVVRRVDEEPEDPGSKTGG